MLLWVAVTAWRVVKGLNLSNDNDSGNTNPGPNLNPNPNTVLPALGMQELRTHCTAVKQRLAEYGRCLEPVDRASSRR